MYNNRVEFRSTNLAHHATSLNKISHKLCSHGVLSGMQSTNMASQECHCLVKETGRGGWNVIATLSNSWQSTSTSISTPRTHTVPVLSFIPT